MKDKLLCFSKDDKSATLLYISPPSPSEMQEHVYRTASCEVSK